MQCDGLGAINSLRFGVKTSVHALGSVLHLPVLLLHTINNLCIYPPVFVVNIIVDFCHYCFSRPHSVVQSLYVAAYLHRRCATRELTFGTTI